MADLTFAAKRATDIAEKLLLKRSAEEAKESLPDVVPCQDREVLVAWGILYLREVVNTSVRSATASIERQSERNREPYLGSRAWKVWAKRPENREGAQAKREEHERLLEEADEKDRQIEQRLRDSLQFAMDEYKRAMYIEWTAELLDSEFATGDGHFVTWGDATVEQHESRMAMHAANAQAGLEGYARHAHAVESIRKAGAKSLREAVSHG